MLTELEDSEKELMSAASAHRAQPSNDCDDQCFSYNKLRCFYTSASGDKIPFEPIPIQGCSPPPPAAAVGPISLQAHPQCCKFRMVICQVVSIAFSLWRPGSWVGHEGCQVLQPGVHVAPFSLEKGSEGKTDLTHLT